MTGQQQADEALRLDRERREAERREAERRGNSEGAAHAERELERLLG